MDSSKDFLLKLKKIHKVKIPRSLVMKPIKLIFYFITSMLASMIHLLEMPSSDSLYAGFVFGGFLGIILGFFFASIFSKSFCDTLKKRKLKRNLMEQK